MLPCSFFMSLRMHCIIASSESSDTTWKPAFIIDNLHGWWGRSFGDEDRIVEEVS